VTSALRNIALSVFAVFLLCHLANAQIGAEVFGKNRIQFKKLEWQFFSGQNVDIYYYGENRKLAENCSQISEEEFSRIIDLFGFFPYHKIKILVYNSPIDMLQSNIGLEEDNSLIGPKNIFTKYTAEVAFRGDFTRVRRDIAKGIADILIKDMLYGGNLKEVLQNAYLLNLPEWFISGLIEYAAEGWNGEANNFCKHFFNTQKYKNPASLIGYQATMAGVSIWHFVASKYGKSNISNILNLTRIIRNEQNSISGTLSISYTRFLKDWFSWYSGQAEIINYYFTEPNTEQALYRSRNQRSIIQVAVNARGTTAAFSEIYKGRYKIKILDIASGKTKTIRTGGFKTLTQVTSKDYPLLAWQGNKLYCIYAHRGYPKLAIYEPDRGFIQRFALDEFQNIQAFDISSDGTLMVFSAIKLGQSDLFTLNLRRNRFARLTKDVYDDLFPSFVPGSSDIVFSSNRIIDTLPPLNNEVKEAPPKDTNYDVFTITYTDRERTLKRLTQTGKNEMQPKINVQGELYYLTNSTGFANLEVVEQPGAEPKSSLLAANFLHYDVSDTAGSLVGLVKDNLRYYVMIFKKTDLLQKLPSALPSLQGVPARMEMAAKSIEIKPSVAPAVPVIELDSNYIDITNYIFEDEKRSKQAPQIPEGPPKTLLKTKPRPAKEYSFKGPFPYENRMGIKNAQFPLTIDPIRGWGLKANFAIFDQLENHKIYGEFFAFLQPRNHNAALEYQFLEGRKDIKLRYERNSIFIEPFPGENLPPDNYIFNRIGAAVSYPLSNYFNVSAMPFGANTRFIRTGTPAGTAAPDINNFYGGIKLEANFDNSLSNGLNLLEGTRGKIFFEAFRNPSNRMLNFQQIALDLRNYLRLHRELTFASRLAGGTFWGPARKFYSVGGMDNWLFQRMDRSNNPQDPFGNATRTDFANGRTDWLFNRFATGLRGFNQNAIYGNSYFILNNELRIPITRYLYKGPVSSNFLKNLQFNFFTDMGSAWTGPNPFIGDNTLNTTIIEQENFFIRVRNFRNPILWGYGAGVRTMFLGYYLKFDVARGVKNYKHLDLNYYLTLGYDF
jgi:hypothetical protein